MGPLDPQAALAAAILNAAFMVRRYNRPGQEVRRAQAILKMGLAARHAFNATEDFEGLLFAVADGLYPFEWQRHDRRR